MTINTYNERKQKIKDLNKSIKQVAPYLKHKDISENLKSIIAANIAEWKQEIINLGGGKNNVNTRAKLRLEDCVRNVLLKTNEETFSETK